MLILCRQLFFKPEEMDSDDDSDFELTNQEEPLLGFNADIDEIIQANRQGTDTQSDDSYEFGSDDEFQDANGDDSEDSEDSMDDSAGDDDATAKESNGGGGNTAGARPTATTSNRTEEDDEEDDVIQRIIANSKASKVHPPDINIDDYVVDLSFHPSEDLLAAGTMTGDVLVYRYSVDECELMNTIEIHSKAIRSFEFDGDGTQIYSASKDRSIMITNVETGKFVREYSQAHEQSISKLLVIDANLFATGDDDGTVKVWDVRDNQKKAIFGLKEVDDYITALLTNDAGKLLLATSGDGYLTTINIGMR